MISIKRSLALVVVSLLVAAWATDAATPLAHREVLPNGMVLLVAERPAVPIVAVRVFTRAGAVLDPPDRAGLANLTVALLAIGAGLAAVLRRSGAPPWLRADPKPKPLRVKPVPAATDSRCRSRS